MNRNGLKSLGVLISAVIAVLFWVGVSGAQDDWPREIATQEGKITVYQPQLESFKGDMVSARAALSIFKKDSKEPTFGVVWFSARAITNRDTRMVEFTDLKIERVKFPFATKEQEKALADFLSRDVNNWERTPMALDRFLAQIAAIEKEKASADQLNTDPHVSVIGPKKIVGKGLGLWILAFHVQFNPGPSIILPRNQHFDIG